MRQNLNLKKRTVMTDFTSYRYKQLLKDREDVLKNVRRSKKISFRQRIDNILKRL